MSQIQAFCSAKIDAGSGPQTVELCHLNLSQALDMAVKIGWLPRNVADAVKPPRWKPSERPTWNAEEGRRFLAAAVESSYGLIWFVALTISLRKGELLGLRWRDIDTTQGAVTIRQTIGTLRGKLVVKPPKTQNSRRQAMMPTELLAVLATHRQRQDERRRLLAAQGIPWSEDDLIFTSTIGGPIHPDNLDRDYDRIVKKAGIKRIRIHDVRHSFATLAMRLGVPIKVISESLGHADVSTTLRIYTHVAPIQPRELAEKMGSALLAQSQEEEEKPI